MTEDTTLTLLGLGTMGTALARAWLADGRDLTVWNRTRARAEALADEGATVARTAAEAVAAATTAAPNGRGLVVTCLLDDASVRAALAGVDLAGTDLVELTTGTPEQARALATWSAERGARFLAGGIMAVPPMIGRPATGGYVFYSGERAVLDAHRDTLAVPADTVYVGADPGHAALYDVALLSAMYGMFAGVTHAFALLDGEAVAPTELAPHLLRWLTAMGASASRTADRLVSGDLASNVGSSLRMQVAGSATLLQTAAEQGVSPELIAPYLTLMRRHAEAGHGEEDLAGLVGLLAR